MLLYITNISDICLADREKFCDETDIWMVGDSRIRHLYAAVNALINPAAKVRYLEKSVWYQLPKELQTNVFHQYAAKTRIVYMQDRFLNSSFVNDLTSVIKHDVARVRTPSHIILSGALWFKRGDCCRKSH